MTSFLRNLLRGGHSKHKKLLEDPSGRDSESETSIAPQSPMKETVDVGLGVRIYVKYIGSTLMSAPKGDAATAAAIKNVIALAKASGKKLQRVILYVTLRGIKVFDAVTEETQLDISIYRISYCSSDAAYSHVFAFIASNANETMECHAFLCRKRKMAQCATLAIAKTFNTAYELWQLSHAEPVELPLPPKNEPTRRIEEDDAGNAAGHQRKVTDYAGAVEITENTSLLIDFGEDSGNTTDQVTWVSFEEDDDAAPKPKNTSTTEQYQQDAWGETFYNNMDLLSLS